MMGPSHAATGAAAWLALTGWHSPVEALHLPAELQLLGALTTAGAALISDWDHPRASVAHALPPVTEWISRGVSAASGGHRQGTHSLLGIAAFTALAVVAAIPQVSLAGHTYAPGQGIIAAFLVATAAKALRLLPRRGVVSAWALGAVVAVLGTVLGAAGPHPALELVRAVQPPPARRHRVLAGMAVRLRPHRVHRGARRASGAARVALRGGVAVR